MLEWKSEDNLKELIFSFLHVDSRGLAETVRLGCKGVYPLSPLSSDLFAGSRLTLVQALVSWDSRDLPYPS